MANQTGYRSTQSFTHLDESDYCEHCSKEDLSKAVGYFYENDSFGPVFRQIVCEPCRDAIKEAEGESPTVCHDCRMSVKVKDTIEWRWHDFYAAQGDEPLVICTACQGADKHKQRVEQDRRDYEYEFPNHRSDDHDDFDDGPEDDMLDDDFDIEEDD